MRAITQGKTPNVTRQTGHALRHQPVPTGDERQQPCAAPEIVCCVGALASGQQAGASMRLLCSGPGLISQHRFAKLGQFLDRVIEERIEGDHHLVNRDDIGTKSRP